MTTDKYGGYAVVVNYHFAFIIVNIGWGRIINGWICRQRVGEEFDEEQNVCMVSKCLPKIV